MDRVAASTDALSPCIGQKSWLRPTRTDQPELLDLGAGTPQDVRDNLHEMWQINRRLGGLAALTIHLFPRLRRADQAVSLLDLGTGGAEIPMYLYRWASRHGVYLHVIGMDWARRNLDVAQRNTESSPITLLRADADRLPFPHRSIDYVISSLFVHHFTPTEVIRLLHSAYHTARRAIIMSDLVRGWLPLAAFRLIQPVFARHPMTRADGALSIRRAYTPDELLRLAEYAGIPNPAVYTHWPWRMTLVVDKTIEAHHG